MDNDSKTISDINAAAIDAGGLIDAITSGTVTNLATARLARSFGMMKTPPACADSNSEKAML